MKIAHLPLSSIEAGPGYHAYPSRLRPKEAQGKRPVSFCG